MLEEKPESVSNMASEKRESPSKKEESSVVLKKAKSEESRSDPATEAHPEVGLEWWTAAA